MNHLLETNRLILRRFQKKDLQDLYEYLSNPIVVAYEPYPPMTQEQAQEALLWRISTEEMIAVELKATGKLIGNVYLGKQDFEALELGYVFHDAYWHQGYALESCRALIAQAFQAGVHRITAQCDPANTPSWKLLERLGFAREGYLRKNVYFRTDPQGVPLWQDTYLYALLNPDR